MPAAMSKLIPPSIGIVGSGGGGGGCANAICDIVTVNKTRNNARRITEIDFIFKNVLKVENVFNAGVQNFDPVLLGLEILKVRYHCQLFIL